MHRRLLSLHAHPDDESSKAAATVAKYASEGVRAVLVTATGGEAGEILNPAMDDPDIADNLTEVRRSELEAAARIIGYDEIILLGYRDSGMPDSVDNHLPEAFCNQPHDEVMERLVQIVRSERPHVLLGYDDHEFYPHPDHLYVHRLSIDVFDAAADPSAFPKAGDPWRVEKLYAPVFTVERILTLHDALIERTGESPYEGWIERIGDRTEPDRTITKIDVSGFIEQGRDALRAHRTQVDPNGFWFQAPTSLVEEVYPWEDFEVLRSRVPISPDEHDLFAGVV
jgi:mycothiol S-conjugate amidase